jgi:tetratricopeptide (TPR) repeat protein
MAKVSVIIPCYNHGHYLAHALQSVVAQSFRDWEAIIVDDGSTDDTPAVAAAFSDPRIGYTYQENQGLAAARNAGIRLAQGEFLAFLDADDLWMPCFLETGVSYLETRREVAGVYTASRMIDAQGYVLPQWGSGTWTGAALHERLLEGGFFPPHTVVVLAEVVRAVGLFDTNLQGQGTEDWDLWLRISAQYRVDGLAEPLALYRVYPGSMATNAARMHACRVSALTKHYGPPEGTCASWTPDKRRAYGFAYRSAALAYIAQGEAEKGWRCLGRGIEAYPRLLERLDTFYELACGDQPRGFRGQASLLELKTNGEDMLRRLGVLVARAAPAVQARRAAAYGNAYLALGMLADQAGDWAAARRYLLRAVRFRPRLLRDPMVVRRFAKLCLGQRLVRRLGHGGPAVSGRGSESE